MDSESVRSRRLSPATETESSSSVQAQRTKPEEASCSFLHASLSWLRASSRGHAEGSPVSYLDGEPAKTVLEVQRSLVFAEGNGIVGVQPFKLLLVVDHENLPEKALVRVPDSTAPRGRGNRGRNSISVLGCFPVGHGFITQCIISSEERSCPDHVSQFSS